MKGLLPLPSLLIHFAPDGTRPDGIQQKWKEKENRRPDSSFCWLWLPASSYLNCTKYFLFFNRSQGSQSNDFFFPYCYREKNQMTFWKKTEIVCLHLVTISRVHDAHINKKIRSGAAIDSRNPISSILAGSNAEKGEKYPWRIRRVWIVVNL